MGQTSFRVVFVALLGALAACTDSGNGRSELLVDQAAERGLRFTATYEAEGRMLFHEIIGPGAALVDFDQDGDLDVYLVRGAAGDGDRLFRNDRVADGPRFVDVTGRVGLQPTGTGMGVTVGDYNQDGNPDIYLSKLGDNELWRNESGFFREVISETGGQDGRWSTGATFADLTGDGWLDLFVVNYVDYRIADNVACQTYSGELDYCGPESYEPLPDRVFHNRGGAFFDDLSIGSGIVASAGAALGVIAGDFSADGRLDVYVANDGMRNRLWINRGDGRLEEEALEAGVAVNRFGEPEASMGVVFADLDRDGDEDLFLTHLATETNTVYRNLGDGSFDEPTASWGLAGPSVGLTGFGAIAADVDGSGWPDLFVANGAVRLRPGPPGTALEQRLAEPNLLFLDRGGTFVEVGHRIPSLARKRVSRGAVGGDIDNDGKPDIVVVNTDSPAELLMNGSHDTSWTGFSLVEPTGGAALGSRVISPRGDLQSVRRDGGYMSSQDPRVLYRGPSLEGAWRLEWAGGRVQLLRELVVDRYYRVPRADS